ncbi:MAG: hypothetical protein AB1498_02590 [bacterium]
MEKISIIFIVLVILFYANALNAFYGKSLKPGEISTNEEGYKVEKGRFPKDYSINQRIYFMDCGASGVI